MFSNIKYISSLFVTLNKKAMKNLTIILIVLSLNCSAQYSKNDYNQPQLYVPLITLKSTFVINELIIRNENYTSKEKSRITAQVYFTGCALTYLSHVVIKKIRSKHKYKKRKL